MEQVKRVLGELHAICTLCDHETRQRIVLTGRPRRWGRRPHTDIRRWHVCIECGVNQIVNSPRIEDERAAADASPVPLTPALQPALPQQAGRRREVLAEVPVTDGQDWPAMVRAVAAADVVATAASALRLTLDDEVATQATGPAPAQHSPAPRAPESQRPSSRSRRLGGLLRSSSS